jgi:hypothetical protein
MLKMLKRIKHFLKLRSFVAKTIVNAIDSCHDSWKNNGKIWYCELPGHKTRKIVFSKRGFFCHLTAGQASFSYGAPTCFIIWLSFYLSSREGKWLLEILSARMTLSFDRPDYSNHIF